MLEGVEVHVDLLVAQRAGVICELRVTHEPTTWRRFAASSGVQTLKPDLLVELVNREGWELRWFVEVDRATEHLPAVIRKCLAYQGYWRSGAETRVHDVFPRVLWSVPDERRRQAIEGALGRSQQIDGDLFVVGTADSSVERIIESPHH